ncbi:extracellular solute-binding protein [Paenibacillus alba]|uniref:ABC transporter substrate-binding protein n=1 Tax=Paenibacillus alba TaxID=1197127 RepID=UPI0015641C54|nr:extracellular solute-binding protein [Paenibacillus alba]NQX71343.1 extracellular solute-binding protein [Paenibacillus alba]
MKKVMMMGAACVVTVSMLVSACGKTEDSTSTPAPSASSSPAAQQVKLKFWGGVPIESGPQAVVDKWNAAHKDIQVEYVRYTNDDPGNTKLDTALLSNTDAPDFFVNYNDALMDKRINAGMIEPLNDLIPKVGFDVDGVIGNDNIMKKDGKIYYLPGTKSVNGMMINKSSLDAVGEKVPFDWTWDEYVALAKKLTKQGQFGGFLEPNWEPIALDVITSAQPVNAYYAPDGTSNLNNPAMRKGLEIQKQLLDAKALIPYAEGVANKVNGQDQLLTGKAAMVYTGTYLIRYIKDDKAYPNRNFQIAFAPTPQWEKGKNVNRGGLGDNISINAKSQNKEASMKFLAWYLNEGNTDMIPGGRIPSNKKADMNKIADLLFGDKGQYFDKDSFMKVLQGNYTFKLTTITTASAEIRKIVTEESEKYFMGSQSIDKAVEALKLRSDQAIKAAK